MKKVLLTALLLICGLMGNSQVIFGDSNYIEYHPGTLPVVISAPHGGLLIPSAIPDRTCNNPTISHDSYTKELALQIDSAFVSETGCHIHLVICNLNRIKLDCNRPIEDGACANSAAENAWTEFHDFLNDAQEDALANFDGRAFYIDLHGHGHPDQRLELGYMLTDAELENTDDVLNTSPFVNSSSIENLVGTNISNSTHAGLLRGPNSLGTMFGNAGFPATPGAQIPFPGQNLNYFTGGYNIYNYTCHLPGDVVNGLQLECNQDVRFTYADRKAFADSLANILIDFIHIHQGIDMRTNCGVAAVPEQAVQSFVIAPNPTSGEFTIHTAASGNSSIKILGINGKCIMDTVISANETIDASGLENGIYTIVIETNNHVSAQKLVILN